MGKASSSKKVARAARAGGRSSGQRQRNLLFPGAIALIVILGTGLIAFAASDRKSEADVAPVVNQDHWHAAVGVEICGEFQPATPEFESRVGIHTHGDGVIHIHPFSSGGAGDNATLGVYLEGAGIDLTDDSITIGDESWTEGDDTCDDEPGQVVVARWADVQSTDEDPEVVTSDFGDLHFDDDGEGYTIAFVPEGTTDIPKPESAAQLAELGAVDGGQAPPADSGDTDVTVPPVEGADTTAPGDAGSTTTEATTTVPEE